MGCAEVKYLLDTHILVWWFLDHPDLPKKYAELLDSLESQANEVSVSVISLWEIAKLVQRGKITASISIDDWLAQLESDPWIQIIPLESKIISESMRLPETFPSDPADQIIAATARCRQLQLLTCDKRIIQSKIVAIA